MEELARQPKYSLRDLKIMIVSTPKTGNTWLRHLLAAIYDLPAMELGFPFDPESASALGQRWIMHQHYTRVATHADPDLQGSYHTPNAAPS